MAVNAILRAKAEALIREQLINTIQQDTPTSSIFMKLAKKLPNMTSNVTRMPVLDMLPLAYWVDGDTGMKGLTSQAWDNIYLNAEELAVIVPIPEAVIADASFDIMGEVTPRLTEAIGASVDKAILFGIDRPANWPLDIVTRARIAGNNVSVTSNANYYDLLLGEGGVISKIEEDGYMSTGALASMAMRGKLRGIKSTDGIPLFKSDMQGSTQYSLDGAPLYFPVNGSFDQTQAQLIVGDFTKAVYAIRQDITVKILDQGVIQDPTTKEIKYNLAQQDMLAIRVVFRMGWALPNPATKLDGSRTGCPFAYLEPATAATKYTANITVEDSSASPITSASVEVGGAKVVTGSDGVAKFSLDKGTYTVKVKAEGYKAQTTEFEVSEATTNVTVTLKK